MTTTFPELSALIGARKIPTIDWRCSKSLLPVELRPASKMKNHRVIAGGS
jgi:hypothetical protein